MISNCHMQLLLSVPSLFIILAISDTIDLFLFFLKCFLAWVPWQHILLVCLSLHWLVTGFYARSLDAKISKNLALKFLCFSLSAIFLRHVFKAVALKCIHRHLIPNFLYSLWLLPSTPDIYIQEPSLTFPLGYLKIPQRAGNKFFIFPSNMSFS